MKTAAAFERDIKLATAGLSTQAISQRLAQVAKASLAEVIGDGEASEDYVRSVNGRIGAAEESVIAPGPIVYQFNYLREATLYALEFAAARSPVRSGRFRDAWFAMVDGVPWDGAQMIPIDAEVIITNDEPYARKIEVGHMLMTMPPHVAEDTRQAIQRRYAGSITAQFKMIDLAGAYILRGVFRRGVAPHSRKGLRKDTARGQAMTYPAVAMQAT